MIERLQRKFVAIAMVSLMLIILIIIGVINAVNLYHMERKTDGAIRMIAENEGRFPEFDREKPLPPVRAIGFEFQFTPETSFETRYFTVAVNEDGAISSVDTSHIAALNEEDARVYTEEILAGNKTKGYRDSYKYRIVSKPYGAMVVVLDCRIQTQAAVVLLEISCMAALFSLALMFILVSILSKRAMKPVQISIEKQKQFITDAGHEIKTPLAIISSDAEVLGLTYGESEWIASIRNQTSRLGELVKKLLTLSKIEEKAARQAYTEFDVGNLVRESAAAFQTMADSHGKSISCDTAPGSMLWGDEDEILQLVTILLDNATKYSAPDGSIQIKVFSYGKKIVLEVRNPLSEPPVDDPDRLFDRFFRADSSRSRESGGYGIGLSIAKAIVGAHKGDAAAIYEDNGQTICFRIQLPK